MYHVLIISENRILLKQVYEMIQDDTYFQIHIVPFSMDAYNVFYRNHADIVIMDTSVFLSYENILEQFQQCHWYYHILLLHDRNQLITTHINSNIIDLVDDELSKELFHEVLTDILQHRTDARKENSTISFDWHGTHTFTIHPDTYHLLLVRSFDSSCNLNSDIINQLIDKSSQFCQLNEVFHNKTDVLFYISRSEINKLFNYTLLSQIIHQILGQHTALIYQKNINWKKLHDVCLDMKTHQDYCYFFSGEVFNLSKISMSQTRISNKEIKIKCSLLLIALLNNDNLSVKHILQELYLHIIKSEINFSAREYIRVQLQFFLYLISKETARFLDTSVEDEFDAIMKTNLLCHNNYTSDRMQEIISTTTITIYNLYDTDISLDGIANELCLNKIYLNRIYKEHFGVTILETLQLLRIQNAKYYLINSNKKVSEISIILGFIDTGYFSKFFRKETGCTALEFRMKRDDEKEMSILYEGIMAI